MGWALAGEPFEGGALAGEHGLPARLRSHRGSRAPLHTRTRTHMMVYYILLYSNYYNTDRAWGSSQGSGHIVYSYINARAVNANSTCIRLVRVYECITCPAPATGIKRGAPARLI